MIKRISDWLYKASTGWVALAALIVFLLFTALVLPRQSAPEAADAGSPDLSLWYSTEDLYRMAEAYGAQGRMAYVRARFTFDLIWPLVYGVFLTTSVSWLFGRALQPGSAWRRINLAPPSGVLFDYLENLSTSAVMIRYPGRTPVADLLAPPFTLVKWVFVGGSFVLLIAGLVAVIWQQIARVKARGSTPA